MTSPPVDDGRRRRITIAIIVVVALVIIAVIAIWFGFFAEQESGNLETGGALAPTILIKS